jgi:hypothetical protein
MVRSQLVAAAVAALSVSAYGELLEREIPATRERSIDARITFGAGDLTVNRCADDLILKGRFEGTSEAIRPDIAYRLVGDVGELVLGMEGGGRHVEDIENDWEVGLNGRIPMDLAVKVGACQAALDASGLQLSGLTVETGASDVTLQFGQPNPTVLGRLAVTVGAARFAAEGLGNANLRALAFTGGVGSYVLDFSGALRRSADVTIEMGIGKLLLVIPAGTSAQIQGPGQFLNDFDAEGYARDGDVYRSPAYAEGRPTLRLKVTSALARIAVRAEP